MAPVLRAAAALTLAAASLLASAGAAHADVQLQAETAATAVHLTITQQPASSIITASLIDDALDYAAGSFDSSGGSDAQAAPAFPGNLVVQGPGLLCSQLFPCPTTPPAYPLLADASYPRNPSATATLDQKPAGSGPLVVTPMKATASATQTGNRADTSAGSASVLAGTPVALTIGASSASSAVTSTGSTVTAHVESVLHDVGIAGLVHIGSVTATDDVTVAQGKRPADRPQVTVTGVTVAGQPASIDNRGIHIGGQRGPSLTRQLDQLGITVHTVGIDRADTATGARSGATGLAVDFAVPVNGLPYVPNPLPPLPPPFDQIPQLPGVDANGTYVGHVTLGAVGVAGGLERQPAFNLGGTLAPAGSGQTGAGTASGAAAGPAGGNQLVQSLAGRPPSSAPAVAAPPASGVRAFVDSVSKDALDALYAVLALGTVALFVGWRGAMLVRQATPGGGRRR